MKKGIVMNNSGKNIVYKNIPSDELELVEGVILRREIAAGGATAQRLDEYRDMDRSDNNPEDIHVNKEYENISKHELVQADDIALRRAAVSNIFGKD